MGLSLGGRQDGGLILGQGTPSLEPVLTHRFLVSFPRVPQQLFQGGIRAQDFAAGTHNQLNFAVRRFSPGRKTVEAGSYDAINHVIRYPLRRGALPPASLDLIIYGGMYNPSYDFFWNWFKLVYDEDKDAVGLLLPGGGIGGSIQVQGLAPDETVIFTAIADDAWPSSFNVADLSRMDDKEAVIASVSFEVNEWQFKYSGQQR